MATTTNYGWTTPDDTALVKDGAAAIRTLGTSVDTTTKALNPSTTLGDIEYRSSTANTNTRLGIGSTGQVLTVAGGVPSWATASSGSFTLIATASPSAASTFEFTSIPNTYRQLFLVGYLKPSQDGNGQNYLEFNGDTGSNYYYTSCGGSGAATLTPFASSSNQVHNNLDNGKDFSIYQSYRNYTATTPKIIESALLGYQYDDDAKINTTYIQRLYSYIGTSAISIIKFYAVTGTYTGTVSLYGQN